MDGNASFGHWVRRRRKALDLTQDALAEQISCSTTTIRKIEADERRPSRQMAELLAQVLEIDPEERPLFLKVARSERRTTDLAGIAPVDDYRPELHTPKPTPVQPRSNLPTSVIPLVGRNVELQQISALLQDPACRLLTLVGPGGIGKTRLALAAAQAITDCSLSIDDWGDQANHQSSILNPQFTDGVWLVALASVGAPELMASTIANTLGLHLSGAGDQKAQLLNYLHEKRLLLVLDNFEHLLPGAGLVAEILQHTRLLKVLVTSRERLNLQGEWVFDLQGLPVPASHQADHLEEYSAVALFVQTARRVRTSFGLSAQNRAAVVQICRLVEGMPLGIELAAAWVYALSCQEIAQEIERTIDFLAVTRRDVAERHRSLRAAFDHSWKLLAQEEQRVLSRLAVFRGGFTRETAEQVAEATLPLLSTLVAKSLLRRMHSDGREPVGGASAPGRYDLHELVRQYALERLRESGEEAVTRARHAHVLLAFAETVEGHLLAKQTPLWLDHLEQERDNLRAALNWVLEPAESDSATERIALGLRMTSATVVFWFTRGYNQEGMERFKALLVRPEAATLPYGRMEALTWRAYFLWEQGQLLEAKAVLDEAAAINETIGDRKYLALGLTCQGHVANAQGDSVTARLFLEQSLVIWREQKAGYWIAEVLGALGDIAMLEQAHDQAERFYTEGVAVGSNSGDALAHPYLFRRLAYLALQRDDYAKALELCQASLRLNQAIVTRQGVTACLIALASVARVQGQFIRAARLFGTVETLLRSLAAPLYATDHQEYDCNVAALRTQLNATDLASAWAAGQAMTAEQAIAYALAQD